MQYKKTVLEQEIIRVSIDLFVRKGVKNTSVRDIAREVHTAPSNTMKVKKLYWMK